jgi:hypothetical protein
MVHLLDYVSVDYPEFVADGKVLDVETTLAQCVVLLAVVLAFLLTRTINRRRDALM